MTSNQVARYRILKTSNEVLHKTDNILTKIRSIKNELKAGGADNNVTNYMIEPVYLTEIWKKTPAFYKDAEDENKLKPLYVLTGAVPIFTSEETDAADGWQLFAENGTNFKSFSYGENNSNTKMYVKKLDSSEREIITTTSSAGYSQLNAPMYQSGQAYIVKARIDDIDFYGYLSYNSNKFSYENDSVITGFTIDTDVLPSCVLVGGKLYKQDTLELIPVHVDTTENVLKFTNEIVVELMHYPLPVTALDSESRIMLYDPDTNVVSQIPEELKQTVYSVSPNASLSRGNFWYWAGIAPTIDNKYVIIDMMEHE